jgi:Flp pilus assembly pilin Flp
MNLTVAGWWRRVACVCARHHGDERGSVLVEYSVLIGSIAIAGALGLVAVGISLVRSFDFVRGLLLCPIP